MLETNELSDFGQVSYVDLDGFFMRFLGHNQSLTDRQCCWSHHVIDHIQTQELGLELLLAAWKFRSGFHNFLLFMCHDWLRSTNSFFFRVLILLLGDLGFRSKWWSFKVEILLFTNDLAISVQIDFCLRL